MTTAAHVPDDTRDQDLGDVKTALEKEPLGALMINSFVRFRYADGFSFARAMAFQVVFAIIPAAIVAVALAVRAGEGRLQGMIRETITTIAPGPAADLFLGAFQQGANEVGRGNSLAILFGGAAAFISAVAGMAQIQRGASRIYGVLSDRPTLRRYGLATVLTSTAGLLLTASFVLIVLGDTLVGGVQSEFARAWAWIRWPIGFFLLVTALAALFKVAPNRDQPRFDWLVLGGGVATLGWLLVSIGLAFYLNASKTFGETYGPLAGFMGVMLWAFLSGIAIFYGVAVSAQLESRRIGIEEAAVEAEEPMPVEREDA